MGKEQQTLYGYSFKLYICFAVSGIQIIASVGTSGYMSEHRIKPKKGK